MGVYMIVMRCDSTCGQVQNQSLVLTMTLQCRVLEEVGVSSQSSAPWGSEGWVSNVAYRLER